MKCKKLLKFEIIGFFVIIALGIVWHNLYELTNQNIIVGLIAPVNESIWEHWKLGIYPILIYSAIEYFFVKEEVNNFLFSKFIGIIVFEIVCFSLTALGHYLFKESGAVINMILHIGSYFIGILAAQIVSYIIGCITEPKKSLKTIALIGIAIHIFMAEHWDKMPKQQLNLQLEL